MKKAAFTLIELLVVIAIIAILAAILFPVFAQAKDAAKTTVALSNVKQTNLAILMYTNDFDDAFPLDWDSDDPTGQGYWTWQGKIYPYTKNFGVVLNPKLPAPAGPYAYWQRLLQMGSLPTVASVPSVTPTDGNYVVTNYLSRNQPTEFNGLMGFGLAGYSYGSSTFNGSPSLTTTSVGDPADEVMVTQATNWDYWEGEYSDATPFTFCSGGWGAGWNIGGEGTGVWSFAGPMAIKPNPSTDSGFGSSCVYPAGLAQFSGVDGHAKAIDYVGQLFSTQQLSSGVWVFTHFYPQGVQ